MKTYAKTEQEGLSFSRINETNKILLMCDVNDHTIHIKYCCLCSTNFYHVVLLWDYNLL